MSAASLRIIKSKTNHPLEPVLVNGGWLSGGDEAAWLKDARYMRMAHVRSKKAGGFDYIVLMSARYNQEFAKTIEKARTVNTMILDEVLDIGGIAMHKLTALDLVAQGKLNQSDIDNASIISLRSIGF